MIKIFKFLGIVGIITLVSACAEKPQSVSVTQTDIPVINAPTPPALSLTRPNFIVLNIDGFKNACSVALKNPDPNFVVYQLQYNDVQALIGNYNAIGTYIAGMNAEVQYYVDYINSINQKNTAQPSVSK